MGNQELMKRYADHFMLIWEDDVSGWDDDMGGEIIGGGAYLPAPYHGPPDLCEMAEDVIDGKKGPTMLISYRDAKMPRDIFMDVVTAKQLEDAIANNDPLHDPEMTIWAEKNGWKGGKG